MGCITSNIKLTNIATPIKTSYPTFSIKMPVIEIKQPIATKKAGAISIIKSIYSLVADYLSSPILIPDYKAELIPGILSDFTNNEGDINNKTLEYIINNIITENKLRVLIVSSSAKVILTKGTTLEVDMVLSSLLKKPGKLVVENGAFLSIPEYGYFQEDIILDIKEGGFFCQIIGEAL